MPDMPHKSRCYLRIANAIFLEGITCLHEGEYKQCLNCMKECFRPVEEAKRLAGEFVDGFVQNLFALINRAISVTDGNIRHSKTCSIIYSAVTHWCKLTLNIAHVGRPSTDICRLHKLTSKRNYLIKM